MIKDGEVELVAQKYIELQSQQAVADDLGKSRKWVRTRIAKAAERGLTGTAAVMPGFKISKVTNTKGGDIIQQRPDLGAPYKPINDLMISGRTTWAEIKPDGSRVATREVIMERKGAAEVNALFTTILDELKQDLPKLPITPPPALIIDDLAQQYTITDSHFGALAWGEESGADYDLNIAEKLHLDWAARAVSESPPAHTGILAQIGDLMHHDALESVTPAHGHVLDADSRLQKMVRVVVRTVRRIIAMMLEKHQHVHVIMAEGNHDPSSSAWLREVLVLMYEDEPRITVDNSPQKYYHFQWGRVGLFYHHGHKSTMKNIDSKISAEFRHELGQCDYAYIHMGHRHSDEFRKTGQMYIEQHETLAARDAYGAAGPWWSGRSAKRITYHKQWGEKARATYRTDEVVGSYEEFMK